MITVLPTDRVFVLTGAGISAESGLPTFRGVNGLWRGYRVEQVASPHAWAANPEMVWQFYSERRRRHAQVKPNPAHFALAEAERLLGDRFFLCTQNVDNLHEQAGSHRVMHMHGKLMQSRCESCARSPFDDARTYDTLAEIPACECGARIRPHICWFGETPFGLDQIFAALQGATVFISIGTSGVVEPAASFVAYARHNRREKVRTFYVGPEEPANAAMFDEILLGKAGELLPGLINPH